MLILAGVFSHSLTALAASLLAILGMSYRRKPEPEGEDYFTERLLPRVRNPRQYAVRHPVESAKRALRRFV